MRVFSSGGSPRSSASSARVVGQWPASWGSGGALTSTGRVCLSEGGSTDGGREPGPTSGVISRASGWLSLRSWAGSESIGVGGPSRDDDRGASSKGGAVPISGRDPISARRTAAARASLGMNGETARTGAAMAGAGDCAGMLDDRAA
jgi:hypothetical protein